MEVSETADKQVIHTDLKPTAKQVFGICRRLCKAHSVEFPRNREQASRLIEQLEAQGHTVR